MVAWPASGVVTLPKRPEAVAQGGHAVSRLQPDLIGNARAGSGPYWRNAASGGNMFNRAAGDESAGGAHFGG
jgi:hypothetical protein